MAQGKSKLILASGSPRRLELLGQIGIKPDFIKPVDLDETPQKAELPRKLAERLAQQKAQKCLQILADDAGFTDDNIYNILASDTVVGVGRRVLGKAENAEQAIKHLKLLSGRAHRVFTSVAIIDGKTGAMRTRVVETRLKFKCLSVEEITAYIASNEWQDKAGAYGIQGKAAAFIISISGSYSNVVGLPIFETTNLLRSVGLDPIKHWG